MRNRYKHGGGYIKASVEQDIDWHSVSDYSTSINWKATEFSPDSLLYSPQENIEYPDSTYSELRKVITEYLKFNDEHFVLCHGANEGISSLFHLLLLQGYKGKKVFLVGSTYSEYNKYTDLNGFESVNISFEEFIDNSEQIFGEIVVIVNPNTPYGFYHDIKFKLQALLNKDTTVLLDESFIDFTSKPSMYELVNKYKNLFIVHSLTKFFGSAGVRLGLILSSSNLMEFLSILLPPWNISAYESWFYVNMIPKFNKIKQATHQWIKLVNADLWQVVSSSKNISGFEGSVTSYHTLIINADAINAVGGKDFRNYLLNKYKIFVRPTADFYTCPEYSFRVGLRLPEQNIPLINAIKDIG